MRPSGIIRKVDTLGRVVIPKEIRQLLDISHGDPIEIYTDKSTIVLKKYEPSCIFCGTVTNITSFNGHTICPECIARMSCDIKCAL